MNKKELMAIPTEGAPETEIPYKTEVYVEPWCKGGKGHYNTVTNYVYTAQSLESGVLMLNFFQSGNIVMRTFIGKDNFFNQLFPEGKVSEAMLGNTLVCDYNTALYPLNGADEIISEHFKKNFCYPERLSMWHKLPDGIKTAFGYQHTIRSRQREERYQKIRDSIDSCMLEIRPPVKDFDKWVFDHIVSHYIIYSAPSKEGICTHCHNTVQVKAAHGNDTHCPHCRHKVTVLRSGAFHSGPGRRHTEKHVWYIQKLKSGGIAMRLFEICTRLNKECPSSCFTSCEREIKINDEWSMEISTYENGRYFIDADGIFQHSFEYGNFFNTNEVLWCRSNTDSGLLCEIYPAGADIMKAAYPEVKYIPIRDIIRGKRYNPYYLMKSLCRYPFIEYTWKLGLKKLTYDLTDDPYNIHKYINPAGRNITEILGVNKSDIKELVKLDPDVDDLRLYQLIKANDVKASVNDIKSLNGSYSRGAQIIKCLKYQSLSKFIKYINTQAQLRGGEERSQVWRYTLSDYCDYISDAETAGFNLEDTAVLSPYDLTAAHDDADIEARIAGYIEKGAKYAVAIEQRARELSRLYYESSGFIIRPIQTFDELIEESRQMRHCVGSYAGSYAEGHCVILCVRRKDMPEKAFVTMELSKDFQRIIQLRGFKNSTVQEDVKKFCDEWLALIPKLGNSAKTA